MSIRATRNTGAQVAGGMAAFCLVALLLGLPWTYGGVENWVRGGVAVLLAMCVAAVAVKSLLQADDDSSGVVLLPLLPVVGLIAIGALQASGGLAPATSDGGSVVLETIYPAVTRLALAALVAVAAAGLIAATVFSREPFFHGLLVVCLIAASAVAFGGIAMRLTGDDRIVRGAAVFGDPFARFINRNNGAAFLQLGIAAGLALLRSISRPDVRDDTETLLGRGWKSVDRSTLLLAVATLLALCLAGVVASKSRGGMLAAACTLSVAVPFFRVRHVGGRLLMLVAPLAVAMALLLWLGLSSPAVERFESMSIETVLADGRIPHWIDAVNAVEARPVFGAGLGTYGYAYQQFSQIDYENWFEHADNQYLELVVESGAAGVVCLALALALSAFGVFRATPLVVERVLIVSLVTGQAAHAIFDYGIIVPAVALMAAVLWSAGIARLLGFAERSVVPPSGWRSRSLVSVAALVVVVGLVAAHREHRAAWAVEQQTRAARDLRRPGDSGLAKLTRTIEGLAAALEQRPDDAVGHQVLAELLVHRYRLLAAERLRQVDPTLAAGTAWDLTRLSMLHRTVAALARSGASVDAIRGDPLVRGDLVYARHHYVLASNACPRLPGVWNPLASLAFLDPGGEPRPPIVFETVWKLFPANAELLRAAGWLAWDRGETERASRFWKQAYGLRPDGYWEHVAVLGRQVGPREAVGLSYPEKPDTILQVAANIPQEAGVEIRGAVSQQVQSALGGLPVGQSPERYLAMIDRLAGRYPEALDRLSGLVANDPENASLHAELALVYRDGGQLKDARDESVLAAVLDPRYEALRRQIESLDRNMPSP